MKKIFLVLLIISGCLKNIYSQSATPCANMVPICISVGQPFTYTNTTGVSSADIGPAYGCLCTTPNPSWFYMQSSAAGPMTFNLTESTTPGGPPDLPLDFVAWGPFSSTVNACSNLTGNCGSVPSGTTCGNWFGAIPNPTCTGGIVDCSYDISATEAMTLNPTAAGQIFIVMVTNFANSPGYISFDQTSGAATDCSVTCPPTNFTMVGTVASSGANQPSGSTVICNEPFFINPPNLSSSIANPLKDEVTPCIAINYSPYVSNLDVQGTVSLYQNGVQTYTLCPSCPESIGDAGASPGNTYHWYGGFNDPTKSHDFEFCNAAGTTGPTTVTLRNCWTDSVIAGPTVWNTSSASCFTLTSPANTNIGTATYSITPAFGNPGLSDSNSGWAYIDPSLMTAGNTYTVTYTFNNGVCGILNGYYIFTIPSAPVVSVPSQSFCSGNTTSAINFTTTPAGGNISWTNNNTNIGIAASGTTSIASYTAPIVSSTETGTFAVVSSLNGCINAPVTFSVSIIPLPVANAGGTATLTCANTTTVLSGSGGGIYSWTGPGITGGAATATPTINLPGTYNLVVTSTTGCTSTVSTVAVSQNTSAITVATTDSNTITCNTTTASIVATTTASPVSYAWSGTGITSGTTSNSITVNQPGTFNYTVTNTNDGCIKTGSHTVLQNTLTPVVTSTSNTLTCTNTTVNASISTTTTPVSYTWTGTGIASGSGTNTISVNQPGTYNYTVTNTNTGCLTSGSLTVTQNTVVPVVTTTSSLLTCTSLTASASINTTVTPVSYTWTGTGITSGTSSGSITANQPGTFNYTVTNTTNGCATSGTVAINQNTLSPIVTTSTSNTLTCISTTANVIASSTTTPVSYTWTGTGITGGNSTPTITVNQSGTFNYTATNTSNGCTTTGSQTVIQNTLAPTVVATKTKLNCLNSTADAILSTTTTPVSYTWTGVGIVSGATSNSITVNQPGNFSYTVTDTNNGCNTIGSVAIIQNTVAPTVASTTNTLTCTNPTVNASVTTTATPVTYTWTGTGITGSTTSNSISVNQPGTFNYSVTNTSNGCVTSGSLTVTQNTNTPVVVSTTNTLNCTNTVVIASVSTTATPVSYTWTGTGITGSTTSNSVSINQPGTFNYTVTNTSNGCVTSGSIAVTQNTTAPVVTTSNSNSLSCTTTTATIIATTTSTPVSYNWNGTGVTSGNGTATITVNQGGTFNYTVTNTSNGCKTTGSQSVIQNTLAPTVVTTKTNINCSHIIGNAVVTTTTTPVSYTWTGVGITSGNGTPTISVNQPGTYHYSVTNTSNGCISSGSLTIFQNTVSPIVTSTSNTLTCTNSTVNASLSTTATPVSYTWTGTGITGSTNTNSISVNQPGTFNYTVTNTANGCVTTGSLAVTQNTLVPVVTSSNTNSLTCTSTTANVIATTTSTPISYNWGGTGITGGNGTPTITVNQGGTFNYTVTNTSTGCNTTGSQTVLQNTLAPAVVATKTKLNCLNSTADAILSTTTTPVSYTWTGVGIVSGTTSNSITVNQPGNFSYTVTDTNNGCNTIGSVAIIQSTVAPVVTSTTNTLTCTNTTVNASITTTTTPVTYTWTGTGIAGSTNTNSISVNQPGTYDYTVTNTTNGCVTAGNLSVTQNTTAPVVTSTTNTLTCTNTTVSASLSTTATPVSYTWAGTGITGSTTTNSISVSQPGTFNYTITNTANGCVTSGSLTVTQNTVAPVVNTTLSNSLSCTSTSATIVATTTSSPISYTWTGTGITGGNGTATITVNQGGTFNYTATNTSNGCMTTGSQSVLQTTLAPVVTSSTNSLSCTNTTVNASVSTTATPVSYTWTGAGITSGNGTPTISVNQPGTYGYTVTNTSNGCFVSGNVSVTQNTTTPVVTSTTNTLTCTNTTVSASVSTTATPVSYTWTGTGITGSTSSNTISVNQPGTFNYTVTNISNGCVTSGNLSVTQNTTAPVVASNTNSLSCTNTVVIASVSTTATPVSYTWMGIGITGGTTSSSVSINQPGTFNYTVTNTSNGCLTTGNLSVTQNTIVPVASSSISNTISCTVTTATAVITTTTSPATYSWSGSGIVSGNGTASVTVGQGGTFNYTVTDPGNGCFITGSQSVLQTTLAPVVTSSASNSLTCLISTADVVATTTVTPVSYTWTGTGIISGTNTNTISVNQPGTFNYTVTNTSNGCVTLGSQTVIQSTVAPVVTITNNTLTCTNTTVNASLSTTATPVSYTWTGTGITGSTTTNSISVNQPGTFDYTVTNTNNGCITSGNLSVTQNTIAPIVTSSNSNSLSCTSTSATAVVSTTTTPVTYTWNGTGITSGTNTNTISVNQGGTFNYTVTDTNNGCTTTGSESIIQNTLSPVVTASNSNSLSCTSTSATVVATTTATPVTYTWSGAGITSGNGTSTISVNQGGAFNYTVTNTDNGCVTNGSQAVTQNTIVPVVNSTTNTLTCTNTTVNVTVSTTATPVSYTWTGTGITGSTSSNSVSVNQPGTFDYTVTNTDNGCTANGNVTVTQNTVSPMVTSTTNTLTCTNTTVNATVSTTTTPVTYTWTGTGISGSTSSNSISVNQPGTFDYTVTNTNNGCITSGNVSVTQNTIAPVVASSNTNSLSCTSTSATVVASTTTTPVSYTWTGTGITSGTTSNSITVNQGGTFNYTVTDTNNGCTTAGSETVIQNTLTPVVSSSTSNSLSCISTTAEVVATTTSSPVSYTWTGTGIASGNGTSTITVSQGGTFDYTVTNTDNGCTASGSQSVTQNTVAPLASANGGTITCVTTTINLTGGPLAGVTYSWSGSGLAGTTTSASATATVTGDYTLTTTASNGCTNTAVATVTDNLSAPLVSAGTTQSITCNGPAVTLAGTVSPSGSTTTWLGGVCGSINTLTTTACAPGTFTLEATDVNTGCISQSTVAVNSGTDVPQATVNPLTNSITCTNTVVTIGVTSTDPTVTYTWTGTGISGSTTGSTTTVFLPGTYSVTITNTVTNCSSLYAIVVPVTVPIVTANIVPSTSLTCVSTTATLSATPTGTIYTYVWSGAGAIVSGATTPNPVVNTGGNYAVTITDTTSGCQGTYTVNVPTNTVLPSVSITPNPSTITCASPTISIVATSDADPNSVYTWTVPTGGTLSSTTVNNPSATSSGNYSVSVTNTVNGCISLVEVATVTINTTIPTFTLSSIADTLTCLVSSVTVTLSTTDPNLTYSWTPTPTAGGTTQTPTFGTLGNYSCTITNTVTGCVSNSALVSITQDVSVPSMTLTPSSSITCSTSSVTITSVSSPSTGLTYSWNGPGIIGSTTGSTIDANVAGTYSVVFINAVTGCSNTASASVTQNIVIPTLTVAPTGTVLSCSNPSITLNASGTPTYVPTWQTSTGSTTNPLVVTTAGNYTATILDTINGCSSQQIVSISGSSNPPTANAGQNTLIPCGLLSVSLNGTSTSTNAVTYSWSGPSAGSITSGANGQTPIVNEVGVYTLTLTDPVNGCVSTSTTSVGLAPNNVTAAFTADPPSGFTPLDVTFTNQSANATNYSWDLGNGITSTSVNPTMSYPNGDYTVTLIASNGLCSDTAMFVIQAIDDILLEIPNVFTPNGDGVNEVFTIKSIGFKEISLQIFNRWGQKLHDSTEPKAFWDGFVPNGEKAPEGTYFFFVKATAFDGRTKEQHGTVNLFR